MRIFFLFLGLICFTNCTKAELNLPLSSISKGRLTSAETFGGSKNDVAQAIISTLDGGFAVLGYTQSMDGDITGKQDESFDFWLLKFDEDANLLWNKTFGGSGDDRGRDIIQTQDGGFAITGYSDSSDGNVTLNNGARDFWVLKLDSQGNLLWENSLGFSGNDEGLNILETTDGHIMISGVLDVTASGGEGNDDKSATKHAGGDFWVIKLTQNGGFVWSRYFGGSFTDTPNGFVETLQGDYIIVGSSDSNDVDISNNKGSYDFWVTKVAQNGDLLWEKSFGGSQIDEARGIVSSNDGNYVIIGDTRSEEQDVTTNNGGADLWIIKISDEGILIWEKTHGGSGFDVPRSISTTNNGEFLISGSSRSSDNIISSNQGQNDAWILTLDASGNLNWQLNIGGSEIDFAYDAVELNNGTIIAVGESNSSDGDILENKGFTDLLIMKIN